MVTITVTSQQYFPNYTGMQFVATHNYKSGRTCRALGQTLQSAVRNLSRKAGIPVDQMQIVEINAD
jgi:hypothetical protein